MITGIKWPSPTALLRVYLYYVKLLSGRIFLSLTIFVMTWLHTLMLLGLGVTTLDMEIAAAGSGS